MHKQIRLKHPTATDMNFLRLFLLSFLVLFLSCNKNIIPKDQNTYYFYFENDEIKMNYLYGEVRNRKKYFYNIEKAANIFFDAIKKQNSFRIKKIRSKDTIGLGVKSFNWLNQFDNTSRDKFFNSRPVKRFFIIEKDSLGSKLNLIEVKFIDEIE